MPETPDGETPINAGIVLSGSIRGPGFFMGDLLTEQEREVISMAGRLWDALCGVIDRGPTRAADCAELIPHVHAIQHAVMAQAAARFYPEEYRPLGGSLREPEPEPVDHEAIRDYWTEGPGSKPYEPPPCQHPMSEWVQDESGGPRCSLCDALIPVGRDAPRLAAHDKDEPPKVNWLLTELQHVIERVLDHVISDAALARIDVESRPLIEDYARDVAMSHRVAEPKGVRLVDVNLTMPQPEKGRTRTLLDWAKDFGPKVTGVRLRPEEVTLIFEDDEHGRSSVTLAEHIETGRVESGHGEG